MRLENGYETKTTFFEDFNIANAFGADAIKDTFERAFKEWKNNLEYVTELAMVMSIYSCYFYEKNENYMIIYSDYYHKVDDYVFKHFKGEDLIYYIKTTD
jgi:hypothetical protein